VLFLVQYIVYYYLLSLFKSLLVILALQAWNYQQDHKLFFMTNRYPDKNLLKAKTVVTMESAKLSNHVLNYFKGSHMDHFDQMLKDISQETQNKNVDLMTTTETYQAI
jgi:hypothetical protein